MSTKDSLLNRFDHWLHEAPANARSNRQMVRQPHREVTGTACTGRHTRQPFYIRWWLGAHRDE